jgi:hypothetical protein
MKRRGVVAMWLDGCVAQPARRSARALALVLLASSAVANSPS